MHQKCSCMPKGSPEPRKSRVVYKCKCEECGQLYVGETERSLGERAQEHDKLVKEGDSKSALIQHHAQTGHKVLNKPVIEGVGVIDTEPMGIHIKKSWKLSTLSFEEPPSTEQEGMTCLISTYRAEEGTDERGQKRLTGHASMTDTTYGYGRTP